MVTALEAMEHCRRHRQIERELQQHWRATVSDGVFRWWRLSAAQFSWDLSASDIGQIESTFVDQLLGKINELLQDGPSESDSKATVDYVRSKATSYGIELFKCWLKHVSPRRAQHRGSVARVLIASEAGDPTVMTAEVRNTSTRWCVDSGANRDICRDIRLFNGRAKPKVLTIGEAGQGHSFSSQAEGPLSLHVGGKVLSLFSRTIYADKVQENIMSVSEAVSKGYFMVFSQAGVMLFHPKDVHLRGAPILTGPRDKRSGLFYFDFPTPLLQGNAPPPPNKSVVSNLARVPSNDLSGHAPNLSGHPAVGSVRLSPMQLLPVAGVGNSLSGPQWFEERRLVRARGVGDPFPPPPEVFANLSRTYHEYKSEFELWHPRLAHINPRMALLAKPDLKDWPRKSHCDDCTMGKFHKQPHSGKRPTAAELPWAPGEYLTCDLFGPLLPSVGGAIYAEFYIDIKSRFAYFKPLVLKTEHYEAFEEVAVDVKARSARPMRFFKSDGDGIFTGSQACELYAKYGVRHIRSAPGDSASNDIAERAIRTFAELTRANLLHANAPPNLWAEAMALVVHVWNHIAVMPNTLVPGSYLSRTSILEGHDRRYDLSVFRAFGTKCHFMLTLQKKGGRKEAVGPKAKLGAIIGIEDNMPAYRVLDFEERNKVKKIPFAQVVTHEGHYPFRNYARWTDEERELPESFIPTMEAYGDAAEWRRFRFSPNEVEELESGMATRPSVELPMANSAPPWIWACLP
jgi:hypothetical protein